MMCYGKSRMEPIIRHESHHIRLQNEIWIIPNLSLAELVRMLDNFKKKSGLPLAKLGARSMPA